MWVLKATLNKSHIRRRKHAALRRLLPQERSSSSPAAPDKMGRRMGGTERMPLCPSLFF